MLLASLLYVQHEVFKTSFASLLHPEKIEVLHMLLLQPKMKKSLVNILKIYNFNRFCAGGPF